MQTANAKRIRAVRKAPLQFGLRVEFVLKSEWVTIIVRQQVDARMDRRVNRAPQNITNDVCINLRRETIHIVRLQQHDSVSDLVIMNALQNFESLRVDSACRAAQKSHQQNQNRPNHARDHAKPSLSARSPRTPQSTPDPSFPARFRLRWKHRPRKAAHARWRASHFQDSTRLRA